MFLPPLPPLPPRSACPCASPPPPISTRPPEPPGLLCPPASLCPRHSFLFVCLLLAQPSLLSSPACCNAPPLSLCPGSAHFCPLCPKHSGPSLSAAAPQVTPGSCVSMFVIILFISFLVYLVFCGASPLLAPEQGDVLSGLCSSPGAQNSAHMLPVFVLCPWSGLPRCGPLRSHRGLSLQAGESHLIPNYTLNSISSLLPARRNGGRGLPGFPCVSPPPGEGGWQGEDSACSTRPQPGGDCWRGKHLRGNETSGDNELGEQLSN